MELYNVEGPVPNAATLGRIDGNGGFQQSLPQNLCIGDTAAGENPRLMFPARMVQIEAVASSLRGSTSARSPFGNFMGIADWRAIALFSGH